MSKRTEARSDPDQFVEQCITGGVGLPPKHLPLNIGPFAQRKVVDRLLQNVVLRRKWSLHRHVHLVSAFEQALSRGPITSFLSIGCGAGQTELFLAAANPDIHFTLTDLDPVRLDQARTVGEAWGIPNVTYGSLDLLAPRTGPRFDLVTSIEVLEHIEEDVAAARNLVDHAERFAYVLVPYCSEEEAADEKRQAWVWENNRHHRPGYTHRSFAETVVDIDRATTPTYVRNAYFMPEGYELRERLKPMSREELIDQRRALVTEVAGDVQDRLVDGGTRSAQAIETLLEVTRAPDAPA